MINLQASSEQTNLPASSGHHPAHLIVRRVFSQLRADQPTSQLRPSAHCSSPFCHQSIIVAQPILSAEYSASLARQLLFVTRASLQLISSHVSRASYHHQHHSSSHCISSTIHAAQSDIVAQPTSPSHVRASQHLIVQPISYVNIIAYLIVSRASVAQSM